MALPAADRKRFIEGVQRDFDEGGMREIYLEFGPVKAVEALISHPHAKGPHLEQLKKNRKECEQILAGMLGLT